MLNGALFYGNWALLENNITFELPLFEKNLPNNIFNIYLRVHSCKEYIKIESGERYLLNVKNVYSEHIYM